MSLVTQRLQLSPTAFSSPVAGGYKHIQTITIGQHTFLKVPFGKLLASQIADGLAEGRICVLGSTRTTHPKAYCLCYDEHDGRYYIAQVRMGEWDTKQNHEIDDTSRALQLFSSRQEFVDFVSKLTDYSCSGLDKFGPPYFNPGEEFQHLSIHYLVSVLGEWDRQKKRETQAEIDRNEERKTVDTIKSYFRTVYKDAYKDPAVHKGKTFNPFRNTR
ncbi:unnamed protein product [Vitrella brassicaformis CCMP3155]|uniref:Uncharacterized protein n=1 Tax=Vitrella brassicaformis (strain CCMP3155) TaxID=1169540 RepID=A0A0G4GDI6_VITBC|nr:unnamed protein product [Vitrella brassicaformis CCMP3155]|eukprot:CEM27237.1 unnamed protein product [Vitrella brassicaformis CCMP3155]